MSMQLSNWLMRHPGTRRPFRLYCLPYAGGSGTVFLPWQDALRSDIEVCGIQLPGRGARLAEPPMTSIQQVAETLAQIISLHDRDLPFAFFGHSLGGLVAFELTRYCRRYQLPMPVMIIASGSDAPQHRTPEKNLHTLPDDELLLALADYNGTPPEVLRHGELMSLALPSIRADFAMAANYAYQPSLPLDVPITVLAGKDDPHISQDDVVHWKKETTGPFNLHWFEGGHFFINAQREAVLGHIEKALTPLLPGHRVRS